MYLYIYADYAYVYTFMHIHVYVPWAAPGKNRSRVTDFATSLRSVGLQ